MVTVALSGATSGFGLTVLRTFAANPGPHTLVLLSRTPQPEWTAKGVDVRPVDYTSRTSLVQALQGVHTVLSMIGASPEAMRDSQLALVAAAKEAGVRRFAPSEYVGAGGGYRDIDLYAGKGEVWEAVKASGMQYTRFACGIFMSIFATGTPKPVTEVGRAEGAESGEEEALAGLRPWSFMFNMLRGTADLPGDGSAKFAVTDTRDVARFVIAALDLDVWPAELGMRGSLLSFDEAVAIVGRVQGRKFLVRENSVAELEAGCEVPEKRFYNQVRLALVNEWGVVGDDLNRAFPDIRPVTVEDFVEKWWSGVEVGEPSWGKDQSFM